jgi:hypothetical protein
MIGSIVEKYKSSVCYGGKGGSGGSSNSSNRVCTESNPYGRSSMDRQRLTSAPFPKGEPKKEGSLACNIGRTLSTIGQASEGLSGTRSRKSGSAIGVVGELMASVYCPSSGIYEW